MTALLVIAAFFIAAAAVGASIVMAFLIWALTQTVGVKESRAIIAETALQAITERARR